MPPSVEAEIDRLYQLPPSRFTAARNTLAREVGGQDGARIRSLPRPTLPASAVNSLYWRRKPVYERIVRAAEGLRRAQEALLTGKTADLRSAAAAHRSAVNEGLKELDVLAAHAGRPLTPSSRQAVRQILEALPGGAEPGRLATSIEAPGFEVFAGVDPRSLRPTPAKKPGSPRAEPARPKPRPKPALEVKTETGRKAGRALARKALLEARRRARSARAALRKVRASMAKAAARLEEERRRERRARELHDEARRGVESAEREAERLRSEADSAEALLRSAQDGEERARSAFPGGA